MLVVWRRQNKFSFFLQFSGVRPGTPWNYPRHSSSTVPHFRPNNAATSCTARGKPARRADVFHAPSVCLDEGAVSVLTGVPLTVTGGDRFDWQPCAPADPGRLVRSRSRSPVGPVATPSRCSSRPGLQEIQWAQASPSPMPLQIVYLLSFAEEAQYLSAWDGTESSKLFQSLSGSACAGAICLSVKHNPTAKTAASSVCICRVSGEACCDCDTLGDLRKKHAV